MKKLFAAIIVISMSFTANAQSFMNGFLQAYANNFWANYNAIPQQYRNQATPVQNYNSVQQSTIQPTQTQTTRDCRVCNGTGRLTREQPSGASFGLDYEPVKCQECGKTYNRNGNMHIHIDCQYCHGTGRQPN